MDAQRQEYKGHQIELRRREGRETRAPAGGREDDLELLIDGRPVPYGRLRDGQYALREYAFDWSDNLMDLARRFIDYRERGKGGN